MGVGISTTALESDERLGDDRAVTIHKNMLGAEYPGVAATLKNYAGPLRKMGYDVKADTREKRAGAIRPKRC